VEIAEIFFTTRRYDVGGESFTLPAGTYTALRIVIGEGQGDNWWCVMFPTLCLPAVTEPGVESAITVPEKSGGSPQVRFAIFEFFSRMFKN
jgi:stage II sporulation protein R